MNKYDILKNYYGYTSFRGGQEALIDGILSGRDVLGIMPTGGGKSICYQVPAMLLSGITIVISPLISLMKDQVMALQGAGIPAAYLNSTLTYDEGRILLRELREGRYKILYVAPERLDTDGFSALASTLPISLVAVDEAHCISEWGNDFRPSYNRIMDFVSCLATPPVVAAFTATATERVREDIMRKLRLRDPLRVVTGFDRPNLRFEVLQPANKRKALLSLVSKRRGECGIVYCATRSAVDSVCELLCENGYSASKYHAGLEDDVRRESQEDFIYDRCDVMVATNAFGMGIDKSNVSYVIHYNMPKSLEAYYQEAGRAGRDGQSADCILLYSSADIRTAKVLIDSSEPSPMLTEADVEALRRRDRERLDRMIEYCKTTRCLRGVILDYFGQEHGGTCGNCGNCTADFAVRDVTVEAQKILSCIKRCYAVLGYNVGLTLITKVLKGSEEKRLKELRLDSVSTYGIMKDSSTEEIRDIMTCLTDKGYVRIDSVHGGAYLTAESAGVLFRGERVEMEYREAEKPAAKEKKKASKKTGARDVKAALDADLDLFERLRVLRAKIAADQGVPAYIVFTNAALANMTDMRPVTMDQFLQVSGVGKVKAEQYGETFIREIREYLEGGEDA